VQHNLCESGISHLETLKIMKTEIIRKLLRTEKEACLLLYQRLSNAYSSSKMQTFHVINIDKCTQINTLKHTQY